LNSIERLEERSLLSGGVGATANHITMFGHPDTAIHYAPLQNLKVHHHTGLVHTNDIQIPAKATLTAPGTRTYSLMDIVPYKVALSPSFAIVNDTIQEKAPADANWISIGTSTTGTVNAVQRLAGNFQVRAVVTYASIPFGIVQVVSPVKDINVDFPTYATIIANKDVVTATDAAWAATKKFASDNSGAKADDGTYPDSKRRELSFYILLDTSGDGTYKFSATKTGPTVGPEEGAGIDPGATPADVPSADKASAIYTVALFHTHTPTTYRIDATAVRPIGPSGADNTFITNAGLVGVVYDYVGTVKSDGSATNNAIPFGYNLNGAATLYATGLNLRTRLRN
jgi:hypothetical protein